MTLRNRGGFLGLGLLFSALLGACSPLGALNIVLGGEADGAALRDVAYGPDPRHRLDVYQPAAATAGPRPAVVFFYGGSWRSGDRADYRFVGRALAERGIVAIVPDYRLYPKARFPDFQHDGAKVLRWVFDNAGELGIDVSRISLAGHSAGAHLAVTLALDPRYLAAEGLRPRDIAAVVGIAGPYDFDPLAYRSTRPVFETLVNIDLARPTALAVALATVADTLPAFLLLHGRDDSTVYTRNSQALAVALRGAGARVRLALYDDVGHSRILLAFFPAFANAAPVLDDLAAVVDEVVAEN